MYIIELVWWYKGDKLVTVQKGSGAVTLLILKPEYTTVYVSSTHEQIHINIHIIFFLV